ncbi:hypothetical protein [Brumimicrobium mesophilum]|uniref:hypothetical protein n=1 Tax=Brumimicrobium mesophilum TaxID=392717 RepID=UPI00131E55D5|nr:hypothetical protein [Brumimicrobium mesophilum]
MKKIIIQVILFSFSFEQKSLCGNKVSTDHYSSLNAHLSNNNPHLTPYDDLFRNNA